MVLVLGLDLCFGLGHHPKGRFTAAMTAESILPKSIRKSVKCLLSIKVVGTNTTDEALIKYRPDIKGNSEGGTRTCYVVKLDLQWSFSILKYVSGQQRPT